MDAFGQHQLALKILTVMTQLLTIGFRVFLAEPQPMAFRSEPLLEPAPLLLWIEFGEQATQASQRCPSARDLSASSSPYSAFWSRSVVTSGSLSISAFIRSMSFLSSLPSSSAVLDHRHTMIPRALRAVRFLAAAP